MKKSLLLIAILALGNYGIEARTLTPSEALSRALNSPEAKGRRTPAQAAPALSVGAKETPAVYVFNSGDEGYLIVSADDVAAPVLGYSDSGTVDSENMPENMRWWLEQYRQQIEAAATENLPYRKISRPTREPITPMIKTAWDQSAPYNNLCPSVGGQLTVTGCVATAMAQVMKYHNWPDKAGANATFSYKWQSGNRTLSADYANFAFDWENMMDNYNGPYNEAQGNAVANLMKACGYSLGMDYGVYDSGVPSDYVGTALIDYFKYDEGMRNEPRGIYTLSEWEDMIYNDLKSVGPVLYGGNNNSGGHCFVCDGYSENGYFHINWGWSGISDGYFLLNALDPYQQGIGGSTSGYNGKQSALFGAKPAGNSVSNRVKNFACNGILDGLIENKTLTLFGDFANYSTVKAIGSFCLKLTDETGKEIKTITGGVINENSNYQPGSWFPQFSLTLSTTYPEGTYRIYPVFKSGTEYYPYKCSHAQAGYLILTRSGNTFTVSRPDTGEYSTIDLKLDSEFYVGSPFAVSGNAKFSGDVDSNIPIYGLLLNADRSEVLGVGEELNQEFTTEGEAFKYISDWFSDENGSISVTAGQYYFMMAMEIGDSYQPVSEPILVNVKAKPAKTAISVSGTTVENPDAVDPANVVVKTRLECTEGYFFGTLEVAVFKYPAPYDYVSQFSSEMIPVSSGESRYLTITGSIPGAKAGEQYFIAIFNGSEQISDGIIVSISDNSGISDIISDGTSNANISPNPAAGHTVVTAASEIKTISIVSLGGAMIRVPLVIDGCSADIDVSSLIPGLYIVRIETDERTESIKLIKK